MNDPRIRLKTDNLRVICFEPSNPNSLLIVEQREEDALGKDRWLTVLTLDPTKPISRDGGWLLTGSQFKTIHALLRAGC